MSTPLGPILSMWEAEGNRHAAALDACAGAVVIGERPSTAAEVALGIARVQARRRRVAVADAVGELAPLEDLVPMDAPYGLVDSFFYGVSLKKIAFTVDPAKNLMIFPSGAIPIDHEALLGSDRWAKLLDGFRAAEGLLLIVAPAESSALASLIEVMDGVVLVGNVAAAPGTRVLAHARLPMIPARPTPRESEPAVESEAAAKPPRSSASAVPLPSPRVPPIAAPPSAKREEREENEEHNEHNQREEPKEHEERAGADGHEQDVPERATALVPPWARDDAFNEAAPPPPGSAKALSFWFSIAAGAIVVAGLLTWATTAMLSRGNGPDSFAGRPADSTRAAARAPAAIAASTPAPSSPPAAAAADSAPWSVVLADVSSATGANSELDLETERGLLAVTYAPYARADGSLSYVVLAGAGDSARADSLLRVVRAKRYKNASAAHIAKLPYAVEIQRGISREQASMFVHAYVSKGLPVYPLLQPDGSATLYAGAFRSVEQAQPLMTSFRANGDQPTVKIRTGRPF